MSGNNNYLNRKEPCNIHSVGRSFIISNKQRPDKEGVYEVIRTDGSKGFNYFDGSHWIIDIEAGEKPVKEWR